SPYCCHGTAIVNKKAPHSPRLNPHLTKSRLNDAPRFCQIMWWVNGPRWHHEGKVEIVLGAGGMDKSRVALGGRHRGKSSGKAISHNLFGGLAAACLALGCGWTIYTNIIAASVYPTLEGTGYDQPVARHSNVAMHNSDVAMPSATQIVKEAFAALPAPPARQASTETAPPITSSMFTRVLPR